MMEFQPTRISDVLNLPISIRVNELSMLIETLSLKELQDLFPTLIHSIFGCGDAGVGWGLRIILEKFNPEVYHPLYSFFNPHGPMFRLCYRLLNDTIKYEIPLSFLPLKMRNIIEGGRYSSFYSDLVTVDPFRRQIISLNCNAFDYYMFHFAIHGMRLLHLMSPAALSIHNEKMKTVYFSLVADYLCAFLPGDPSTIILPQITCAAFKTSHQLPNPIPLPSKSPKYLMLSSLHSSHQSPNSNSRIVESPRANVWRTESVLFIFTDIWLRYDVDDSRDLPGNEFIRMIRILVKQLHDFANSAELDNTSMTNLRQQTQPILNARMYPFLKSIISRWPLDSSFMYVLELWLSYIQPWRYFFNRDARQLQIDRPIIGKYASFVAENLIAYTQIFARLIPRFQRMDLSTYNNVIMLYRLLKVFNQSNLSELIKSNETAMLQSNSAASFHQHSLLETSTPRAPNRSPNRTGQSQDLRSFNRSNDSSHHPHNLSAVEDTNYVYFFGPDNSLQITDLMRKIETAKVVARDNVETALKIRSVGFFAQLMQYLSFLQVFNLDSSFAISSDDRKIPDILEFALNTLSPMFNIPIEEPIIQPVLHSSRILDGSMFDSTFNSDSDFLNVTPSVMKKQISSIKYTGDPALLPIMSNEVTFLVRFLHQLSCKLNIMFEHEMNESWRRSDLRGKLTRQVLSPPLVIRSFDKSTGVSELKTETLGPRISLRMFASHKTLVSLVFACLFGYWAFNAPTYGILILCAMAFLYILVKSYLNDISV